MIFDFSKIVVRFFPFLSNNGLIWATIFPSLVKFMAIKTKPRSFSTDRCPRK